MLELAAVPEAPSLARRHARRVLVGWGMSADFVADAEMLVSELVTNALRATLLLEAASLDAGGPGEPYPMALRLLASRGGSSSRRGTATPATRFPLASRIRRKPGAAWRSSPPSPAAGDRGG